MLALYVKKTKKLYVKKTNKIANLKKIAISLVVVFHIT